MGMVRYVGMFRPLEQSHQKGQAQTEQQGDRQLHPIVVVELQFRQQVAQRDAKKYA